VNVLLIGGESAGIQMLRALEGGGHRVIAVMASPSAASSSGSLWNAATRSGFETWPVGLVKDAYFANKLRSQHIDIILNVHSLYVIPAALLGAARVGAFNLHPGPLPRYAGLNAVSWAIYRGEKTHGVTIHKMVPEVDAGPVVYQTCFEIADSDTALSLYSRCVRQGIALMVRLLDVASTDTSAIPLVPQDLSKREYFGKEVPNKGWLSWSCPAEAIVNFVRACDYLPFRSPWAHPKTNLCGQELSVVKAGRTGTPCKAEPGTVGGFVREGALVASGDEWVLVERVKLEDRFLKPAAFLRIGSRSGCTGFRIEQPTRC